MKDVVLIVLALVVIVLICISVSRVVVERRQRKAFRKRLYQLTPYNKPVFVYNVLQGTFAFTTYDRLIWPDDKRMKIQTSCGEKLLIGETCTFSTAEDKECPFDHLVERLMSCTKPTLFDWVDDIDRWELAKKRLFRRCEDIYVQLGTNVPPGTTQADVERFNTRCYEPSEIWEALEADVTESVRSRTQTR